MRKVVLLLLASLFTATTGMAMSWTWDLNGTGYSAIGPQVSGNVVTFYNDLGAASATGTATNITQALGADGVLGNGDTFSEFGFLSVLDADNTNLIFLDSSNSYANAYIAFDGLTGVVYDYSDGGDGPTTVANYSSAITNDSYKLQFAPNIGSITIYLDTDLNPGNGALTLATITLLGATGTSPEFVFADAQEGQFGMIGGFTGVLNNVWQFDDGTYFEDWMATYGIPSIFLSSFNLGATFVGVSDNGTDLLFQTISEGSFQLSAVPEPATVLLLGIGLLGVGVVGRKKMK